MSNSMEESQKECQYKSESPHKLHQQIISVAKLLNEDSLTIPEYQRPYKWNQQNIASLFNDIKTQSDKPAYRLGTIVLHQSKNDEGEDVLYIVDGQQRTLTLMLTVMAIIKYYNLDDSTQPESEQTIREVLGNLTQSVPKLAERQKFASDISVYNLHTNFQEILRVISRGELSIDHIDFLLHKCQVVIFILEDESEAFQFFDSQNSRGKELYPHDLLKAFHLREFDTDDQELKAKTVAYWEKLDDDKLAKLFAHHLFRIKHWSQRKSARSFTKNHIDVFKGINLDKDHLPPYAQTLLITKHYIDQYNASSDRVIDKQIMPYPFQLDQTIVNGQRFFDMVQHYHTLIKQIKQAPVYDATLRKLKDTDCHAIMDTDSSCCSVVLSNHTLNKQASAIIHTLNTYSEGHRKGDKYTRNLFDNALIYYIDKFGTQDLSRAIEMIFIWAYGMRLTEYAVRLSTLDNTAKSYDGIFRIIQQSISTKEILVTKKPSINETAVDKNNKPINEDADSASKHYKIYKLFKHLNYLV